MQNKPTKDLRWGKTGSISTINDEARLTGFALFGSIGSTGVIDYGGLLHLTTSFKIINYKPFAALLDIDFNNTNKTFASMVLNTKEMLSFVVQDSNKHMLTMKTKIPTDEQWHTAELIIKDQTVMSYVDKILLGSYTYKDVLSSARVHLGNNNVDDDSLKDGSPISFCIKNTNVTTSFNDFPCNYLDLEYIKH